MKCKDPNTLQCTHNLVIINTIIINNIVLWIKIAVLCKYGAWVSVCGYGARMSVRG